MGDDSPGVHADYPEDEYHRHRALSYSGAKLLLPPSCPALFRWVMDHGRPPKREFDLGHAAHAEVLGVGAEIEILQTDIKKATKTAPAVIGDATNRRSGYTQDHEKEIRKTGKVPLLREEYDRVLEMAAAIRAHRTASALFNPDHGQPEVSLFWHDDEYDVDRRSRLDWLPNPRNGRLLVPDLKSTNSAAPEKFARSVFDFSYDLQAEFYTDGIRALDIAEDVAFLFVAIERTPPYLITVSQLDEDARRIGRAKTDRALATYAECVATDTWPSYSSGVELISPPRWLARQYDDDFPMEIPA